MLKNIICVLIAVVFPLFVSAETLKLDFHRGGHQYEAVSTERDQAGSILFYEDNKLLGKYENLILNESSLTSGLVTVAGDGYALEIDSEGSRNKFHVVVPINLIAGKLYVDCVYKSVYDSVDEARSVGTVCKKVELGKFDISSAINDDGLISYTDKYSWLKSMPHDCANPVGLENALYKIVKCSVDEASDTKNEKIMVFDNQDKLLFSVVGYELVPKQNDTKFILTSDLQNQIVLLNGELKCFLKKPNISSALVGVAKIGNNLGINYTIDSVENCLTGHYLYVGKNEYLDLVGYKNGNLYYFIEMGRNRISSGLFVFDQIDGRAHGVWIGVPPSSPLPVN
jgi:hypothetical protein